MIPEIKQIVLMTGMEYAYFQFEFEQHVVRDCFSDKNEWQDFNLKLCDTLKTFLNKNIDPDQLKIFWENNATFEELGAYINMN